MSDVRKISQFREISVFRKNSDFRKMSEPPGAYQSPLASEIAPWALGSAISSRLSKAFKSPFTGLSLKGI